MSNFLQLDNFFTEDLKFFMPLAGQDLKLGKDLYDLQLDHLANAILVEDYDANVAIDSCTSTFKTPFIFPQGALVSGSFIMYHVAKHLSGSTQLKYDDIDIYFKSKDDAKLFLSMNGIDAANGLNYGFSFNGPMCSYGYIGALKVNLIYGVEYKDPGHLISRFDIRACSMALDPNTNVLYAVRGALEDSTRRILTFNPVPRGVSVRRFTKYIKKGFEADKYQNLFFVELLRSDIYSAELELMTKEY